jgi:putative restriction endonuclease
MKKGQKLWTREELMLAINLYSKIPFGKMHQGNKDVQDLARLINRTPGSVARRLGNFAGLDPVQIARGIKGLTNSGNLAETVWLEFNNDWDNSFEESEKLLAHYKKLQIEDVYLEEANIDMGFDRERWVKTRLNQQRFRNLVMNNYDYTCCITGIKVPSLLIASHITRWSDDQKNICLNALHDKAFDAGLMTISADNYTVLISSAIEKIKDIQMQEYFFKYAGKEILLPKKFRPNPDFLAIHNNYFREYVL